MSNPSLTDPTRDSTAATARDATGSPMETGAPGASRRRLTLVPARPHEGGRTAMTCRHKCGDACSRPDGNTSENEYFGDIVARAVSRRRMRRRAR